MALPKNPSDESCWSTPPSAPSIGECGVEAENCRRGEKRCFAHGVLGEEAQVTPAVTAAPEAEMTTARQLELRPMAALLPPEDVQNDEGEGRPGAIP
mmetsp:Transcript_60374/g.173220  ORF Transcript_60374/g.173220 Transcript_60374/m.173220 type:complete len:97 (-) Transcript_60374:297-587(-)